MQNQGRDWQTALTKHINTLAHEAWIDYQSSPQLRQALATLHSDATEHEQIALEAVPAALDQNQFNSELCIELAYLLCDVLFPSCHEETPLTEASTRLLNALTVALSSIPGIDTHTVNVPAILEEYSSGVWVYRFFPAQFVVLLTASSLREGYLRPLLSIMGIAFASLDEKTRTDCLHYFGSVAEMASEANVSPSQLAQLASEIGQDVLTIDFSHSVNAAVAEFEAFFRKKIAKRPSSLSDDNLAKIIAELTIMVGLDAVKREVISLANFIKVRRLREARNFRQQSISLHLVFSGSPGTGKTTVARLVARLYKALGVLSKGHLVETDRSGLVAGYIGHTALKTKEVVEQALDGVLFVDEAYSLVKETSSDFGSEAIETLLKLMEDNRDRLVVIVAGYTDEMTKFIASNPGLQSRFTRHIAFQDYTANEMLQIFERNAASNNFTLDPSARETLLDCFRTYEGDKGFGNARGVRNVFEAAVIAHANRIASISDPSDDDLTSLVEDDVVDSLNAPQSGMGLIPRHDH